MKMPVKKNTAAFTLIELLAVVAIIAILASAAFPVAVRQMDQANAGKCLTNLRKLHQLMSLYAADHDGSYPISWRGPSDAGTWEQALANIDFDSKRSYDLFHPWGQIYDQNGYFCPARAPGNTSALKMTYGMNFFIGDREWDAGKPSTALKTFQISNQSTIPLIAETLLHNEVSQASLPEGQVRALAYRHNGKCNIVMCDGHIESLTRNETVAKWPYWNSFDPLR